MHRLIPELEDIERDWARTHAAAAAEAARAAGVRAETIIRHGDPADVICAVAAEIRPRLIVIGTHAWTAAERVFAGSVADAVIHGAPVPVVVVPEAAPRAATARHEAARARG